MNSPITLVPNVATAIANISAYNDAVNAGNQAVVKTIKYAQAWYVTEHDNGYLFGPSKYIGYDGLTPELYAKQAGKGGYLDGRVTEKRLGPWAELVTSDNPMYEKLHTALSKFCGEHASFPNKRARISMLSPTGGSSTATEAQQVTALKILISSLSDQGKKDLKKLVWP